MAPGDELVDVIDDQGRTVGVVPRRRMRRERLPHRCVYLLVMNAAGELFVHQRTATKDVYPSRWDVAVGGVLAAGESFDDGARREGREELGVEVEPAALFPFRYEDAHTVVQATVYRVVHEGPFVLQPEEVARGMFLNAGELARQMQHQSFCPDGVAVLEEARRRGLYRPG